MFGNWKLLIGICLVMASWLLVIASAGAMGGPAPAKQESKPAIAEGVLLIDDFESGSLKSPREWWTFGLEKAEPVSNRDLTAGDGAGVGDVGNFSLAVQGQAKDWYAGGAGTYLAKEKQDLAGYNTLVLDIYGNGPDSGTLKIELFDDDNNNWQAEQDTANNYLPIYDDKYAAETKVDWNGWKRVAIPLDDFVDENDGVGDDVWNPQQQNGSGGWLQLQFICLGAKDNGLVNFNVDNITLSTIEE